MKIPTFERRNEIIRMLQEHGYVKAQMLAKQYQVSMETIRKDLTFLEAAGIEQGVWRSIIIPAGY